jgi:prolyl-tRNA editing enzyme YbaK/EbsC (Cys-tRNA(Pro) deacylase)
MKASVQKVADALRALGVDPEITEFAESTRTAEEAARAVGATVGQIVKSLVFSAEGGPLLVLASGAHRVDQAKLELAAGSAVSRANADLVRDATGFSIGGVPPVGHLRPLRTLFDRALLHYDVVWAAAGTPNAVFAIAPARLLEIAQAEAADLGDDA